MSTELREGRGKIQVTFSNSWHNVVLPLPKHARLDLEKVLEKCREKYTGSEFEFSYDETNLTNALYASFPSIRFRLHASGKAYVYRLSSQMLSWTLPSFFDRLWEDVFKECVVEINGGKKHGI